MQKIVAQYDLDGNPVNILEMMQPISQRLAKIPAVQVADFLLHFILLMITSLPLTQV
jgi:hypothetical protein